MKRLLLLSVSALTLLSGCIVPSRVAVVGPVPAVVAVHHVHGPECGHFYGYYDDRPVYYAGGSYTYWDGGTWVVLAAPPVVRYYRPHRRYYATPRHYHHAPRARGHVRHGHPR